MGTAAVLVWITIGVSSVALMVTVIRAQRDSRARGVAEEIRDAYEAAMLGGGASRVVDTAVTVMHLDGRLRVGGPGIVNVVNAVAHDPVERAVLTHLERSDDVSLNTLRYTVMRKPAVQGIASGLMDRGLMMDFRRIGTAPTVWGHVQAALCGLVIPTAFALTVVSYTKDWPRPEVPFILLVLPALVWGVVTGQLMASRVSRRITAAGTRALRAYRKQPASTEVPARRVAVKGASGAPQPLLQTLLAVAVVAPVAIAASGAGSGGDGGGDGGGGDGCGGCGGCGCG